MTELQFASVKLLRRREPYHYQRGRHGLDEYPRPAQPNMNQPVKKPAQPLSTDRQYWIDVYKKYIGR